MNYKHKIMAIAVFFFCSITNANGLLDLPPELQVMITSKLNIKDLNAFCSSSNHLKQLCDSYNGPLWRALVARDFKNYFGNPATTGWKEIYNTLASEGSVSFTCPSNESLSRALILAAGEGKDLKSIGTGPSFSIIYAMKHNETGAPIVPETKKYTRGTVNFSDVEQHRRQGNIQCNYKQGDTIVVRAIFSFEGNFLSPSVAPCYLKGLRNVGIFQSDRKEGDDPSQFKIICEGVGKGVSR